jgi:hypothetical protein
MPTDKTEPSVVDQLAEDAVPTEYPAGVPALKSMLAIKPFSRRAAFKRKYAEVAEMSAKVKKAQADAAKLKGDAKYTAEIRLWAEMDELYQVVSDLLRMAALDEAVFDVWFETVEESDLMTTFNVYQQRTQPGEASSSTS